MLAGPHIDPVTKHVMSKREREAGEGMVFSPQEGKGMRKLMLEA